MIHIIERDKSVITPDLIIMVEFEQFERTEKRAESKQIEIIGLFGGKPSN